MPRSFNSLSNPKWRSPQFVVRAILGVLLAANLIAAGLVLFSVGCSAEDLDRQLASLMSQVITKKALLERTKQHAEAVQRVRSEGDQFVDEYFLAGRTASSTVLRDLVSAAS